MKTPTSATGSNRPRRATEHGFTSSLRSAENGFTSLSRSAEHGFTSLSRSAEHGFTLIELMVVIAIMGVLAGAVIINLPDPRGRLIDEAETFAARTLAVRDEAILTARATRVSVTRAGYRFEQRRRQGWTPISGKPLAAAQWQPGTSATPAQTAFDPTGMADTEARIVLARAGEQVAVTVGADGTIRVGR